MRTLVLGNDGNGGSALADRLKESGYPCEAATAERQCLRRFCRNPYDVLFLDLETPGLDGEKVAREVRRVFPRTKVIPVSAQDDENVMSRFFALGATAFLMKPVASDTLSGVMQQLA